MATLKKYNLAGTEIGTVDIPDAFMSYEAKSQTVKDYIIALRANARQWSASTKTRAEVSHTTKKPHPQKGTGRARQGCLVAPQHRGGGRVHTPRPKFDQHVDVNKRERRVALKMLFADKLRDSKVYVVDAFTMDAPKTKTVANFLEACHLDKRTLFVGEASKENVEGVAITVHNDQHRNFAKSVMNLQKAQFAHVSNVNGYALACADGVVVTTSALSQIIEWLK